MTILAKIVEQKQQEIARLAPGNVTARQLQEAMQQRGDPRDFIGALRAPKIGSIALIAEIKKASPSAGVICPDFDPCRIAREYEAEGASCLSVLTDEKFFQGSLEYLRQIRQVVKLPLLRKDFIIDERQILEAIQWGADAILLIVAILSDAQLDHLNSLAKEASLAVLIEVHNEAELDRAMAVQPELLGVNNRDLTTFKVDLAATERLSDRLRSRSPGSGHLPLLIAESGIYTRADVQRLGKCGAQAILVGESLMKQGDVGSKVRDLIGDPCHEDSST